MISDRSKIENAKKVLRRRFFGEALTSGQLVTGKTYFVADLKSGDDFSNVGGPSSKTFCPDTSSGIFTATGTAPTAWTHGSQLNEWKLEELKQLAEQAFNTASGTPVTLTSSGFEGGSQSGEITFDPSILHHACEELIDETDPGYIMPAVPTRSLGFTVEL